MKHKKTDHDCQMYCNPARYPEVVNPDGTWAFNSSAAEQVNAWFGCFHSVVKEMTPERFAFYLDEMIRIRNDFTVEELRRQGHCPHLVPVAVLSESISE